MKSDGFSLLESLFALSLLSLVVLSLLPIMMQIKQNLHKQNQRTTAQQLLSEESIFHLNSRFSSSYDVIIKNQAYRITYNQEAKQLCATYAKENICYAIK
ncbi:hypothetical protein BMT55_05070 [Listeria newyorkensis]|uniref:Type II secretion system protein n=1 Tax=Listeria newyorkensis TaxID=1497681 RepID=A0ABX4XPX7_9LIST|nr:MULTISPECIES: competence type IV pilus minor pilin ComGE [Listeria]KGL45191.1 hypothetical protein EP56_06445 [Listeriaceae bacterium FSL A5-0209]KGL40085.1 hypothetical protein EP58_13095 [Listeria newyorkensis]PNP93366.1 hypothetical protein BMT55_05070 [Listeria newyorkensis]RQW68173.1 hypothetical protein DUK53_02005 [Listeria sp. SHR_NRA_18]WAO21187.1 competence type IV pilus minor pilin ComGE [Listeria newyorkensis]